MQPATWMTDPSWFLVTGLPWPEDQSDADVAEAAFAIAPYVTQAVRPAAPAPGRLREPVMTRLYYRESYGRVLRDRGAEGRHGIPARLFVTALMVLAAILVLASVVH